MSDFLLALWAALIGADRIDLAGGHAPFLLTPFLALTPIVAVSELVRRHRRGAAIEVPRGGIGYMAIAGGLMSVVLFSAFSAPEPTVAISRGMLLLADVLGTIAIAVLVADRRDLWRVLARGAVVALVVFLVFDVMEPLAFLGRAADVVRVGTITFKFGDLQNAGPLPRLAGAVADANRAAFVLLLYLVVLTRGELRPWVRRLSIGLALVFLLATFSRSGALGAIALVAMAIADGQWHVRREAVIAALIACAAVTTAFIVRPRLVDRLGALADAPAIARLNVNEGSARGHYALVERGFDRATSSVPRALLGGGYGNSYLELQDVFPGNKYGNYHSLYVTMFAEAGAIALVLALTLFAVPLALGSPWRPLVAGAALFNVFYQTTSEPSFWLVMALAWLTLTSSSEFAASRWSLRRSWP